MEQISFLYSQLLDSLEKKKKETCGMMERVQRSETWIVFQHYENKGKLQPGNGHAVLGSEDEKHKITRAKYWITINFSFVLELLIRD